MVDFRFCLLVNWARAIFISPLWGVNVRLYARTRVGAWICVFEKVYLIDFQQIKIAWK